MVDHLWHPADSARNDRCSARHGLDRRQAEKLRELDLAPVARSPNGRQSQDLRAAVEGRKVGIGDDAEDLNAPLRSKAAKEVRIIALGRVPVVPGGADHPQLGILGERFDQSVHALVRSQPSNEEDASALCLRIGPKADGIRPSIDDPRSR